MHQAAVWQRSSNSNIKIAHNSIEHFLWNASDFFSDDVVSCLSIVFTNSIFQVPPQKIVRQVKILGIRWLGLLVLREMSLVRRKLCLRCSSVLFEKLRGASFLEQKRTFEYLRHNFSWDRFISRQSDKPWPCYYQYLNPPDYFLRGYLKDRVCENNSQTREDIIRGEIRWIPQEMLNRVVDNFNVRVAAVLSYSSTVHGMNIVLITEKV